MSDLSESELRQWDEWFENCRDEETQRAWRAAKEAGVNLRTWAFIIESNRIDRHHEQKKQAEAGGKPAPCGDRPPADEPRTPQAG